MDKVINQALQERIISYLVTLPYKDVAQLLQDLNTMPDATSTKKP